MRTVGDVTAQLQRWAVTYGPQQRCVVVLTDEAGHVQFVDVEIVARPGPDGRVTCMLVPQVPAGVRHG